MTVKLTSKLPTDDDLNGLAAVPVRRRRPDDDIITAVVTLRRRKVTSDLETGDTVLELAVCAVEPLDGQARQHALQLLAVARGERTGEAPLALDTGAFRMPAVDDVEDLDEVPA